jgi:acetolactate synthase I/II/III large subunit
MTTPALPRPRTGGQILIDQLLIQGVQHVFCVPGESYLAALDAMHDTPLNITVCRQEGGAAMMAEAHGKLTGQPGICFVTRGPGATNASPGVHVASQDSTPMILLVGQVGRDMRGREAFQELDYRAVFGSMVKWVTEIDSTDRIPEMLSRAFHVAMSGRPGPVVLALPEDVLTDVATCVDALPVTINESTPAPADLVRVEEMLAQAQRPVIIAGGSRWDAQATAQLVEFATARDLPVCVSFRRQSLYPGNHPNYIGEAGAGANPALVKSLRESDLVVLLGTRFSEMASQGYTVLDVPRPRQKLVHIHAGAEELGRVYKADLAMNVTPRAFLRAATEWVPVAVPDRKSYVAGLRQNYLAWSDSATEVPSRFNLGKALLALRGALPSAVTITTGAGNYAAWVNRFFQFQALGKLVAPTSGSMGYGIPAAVSALRLDPTRLVIAFAGDGCFLMNGQEFATAVQYGLPLIVIVADNSAYGTIRMHQESQYPGRVVGTGLRNPDFAAYALAFGGHGERVERTEDFMPAFERALAAGKPAIVHCIIDIEALTPTLSLTAIREAARQRHQATRN